LVSVDISALVLSFRCPSSYLVIAIVCGLRPPLLVRGDHRSLALPCTNHASRRRSSSFMAWLRGFALCALVILRTRRKLLAPHSQPGEGGESPSLHQPQGAKNGTAKRLRLQRFQQSY